MKENEIRVGLIVRAQDDLESRCKNYPFLVNRTSGMVGKVTGVVPGFGGDIWWVSQVNGLTGAYCYLELDLIAEPVTPPATRPHVSSVFAQLVRVPQLIMVAACNLSGGEAVYFDLQGHATNWEAPRTYPLGTVISSSAPAGGLVQIHLHQPLVNLESFTRPELKAWCAELKLPTTGTKNDLLLRLREYDLMHLS